MKNYDTPKLLTYICVCVCLYIKQTMKKERKKHVEIASLTPVSQIIYTCKVVDLNNSECSVLFYDVKRGGLKE